MVDESKEGKKSYSNIFIADTIYPEAKSIFSFHLEPIEKIKDNCYFVLDTNVLIAPYVNGGKDNLLEECQKIYGSLVAEKRLVIPSQVAREFAKVRQDKLAELHQQFIRKLDVEPIKKDKYPLLSSLDELKEAGRLAEEINKKIKEYQKTIGKIIASIREWNWDDPVSILYHRIFTEETILDIQIKQEDIKKDLHMRKEHDIPPGYKDADKKDEGIGDLLIWLTILEVGKLYNKSVIFVTGDEKADWYKKSEKYPLYPRYELVDEFRRASGGCSFHMIRFSRFLDLFGVTGEIVRQIEKDEEKTIQTHTSNHAVTKWKENIITLLKRISSKYKMLLSYDDIQLETIKRATRLYLDDIFFLKELAPSEISEIAIDYLQSITGLMLEIINKQIYLDGGKSIEEVVSIMHQILNFYERLIDELRETIQMNIFS